jgi:molybdenum cofactor cytidylyltransferase
MHLVTSLQLSLSPHSPDVVAVTGGGGKSSLVFRLAREIIGRGQRAIITTTTRVSMRQVEHAPAVVRVAGDQPPWQALGAALDEHGFCLLVGDETLLNGKQVGVPVALIDALALHGERLDLAAILVEADGSRTLPVKAPAEHEPVVPASTTLLIPMIGLDAIGAPLDDTHTHRPERIRSILNLPAADSLRLTPQMAAQLITHPEGGAKHLPVGARLLPVLNKAEGAPRLATARLIASHLAEAGQPSLITAVGNDAGEPVYERWAQVAAIILAAGASSRMGRPKQIELVDGEPMVARALRLAFESGAHELIVVTGAHAASVLDALVGWRQVLGDRLRLVHNADWSTGQASSLAVGVRAISLAAECAIFMPVDQPFVEPALLRRLVAAWRSGFDLAAPLVDDALRGAPALFGRGEWPDLLAVRGDVGGRGVLVRQRARTAALPVAAATLRDVDTPADLE